MTSNWETIRAEDFCFTVTDGTHDSPKAKETGHYLITSKHLAPYSIDFSSAKKISEEDYQKVIKRSPVEQWDILFSMIGTIGITYLEKNTDIDYACKNMGIFKFNGDKDKAFWLYYYLQTPQAKEYILGHLRGTTQQYLPLGSLRDFPIQVPSAEIRNNITSILRSLDDRIAVNTAINENLEQQAQALFKDMIADIQEQVPFTSVIQVLGGGTPKTGNQEYWNGEIQFFTPKDVGNPYVLSTEKSITLSGLDNCNSRLYPVNTVFLTARGTVGKVSLAGVPMAMNQSCYALAGKDGLHQIIVYHYVLETVKALKHKASGAVFDAIITRDFDTESVPALSSEQIESYIAVAEPIYSEILNRTLENQRLSALRDTLLPKLMNGEIDVSAVKI